MLDVLKLSLFYAYIALLTCCYGLLLWETRSEDKARYAKNKLRENQEKEIPHR